MELDEIKELWVKQNEALKETKLLNEKIISKMTKEKSNNELQRILNYEYFSVIIAVVSLGYLLLFYQKIGTELQFVAPYILLVALMFFAFWWTIHKIRYISRIEIANNSIIEVSRQINQFRKMIVRERVAGLPLCILFVALAGPVMVKMFHNQNFFEHWQFYTIRLAIGLFVGVAIALWVYKVLYFKKIQQIQDNLNEISEFERPE